MSKEKVCLIKRPITRAMVGFDCFMPVYESDFQFMQKCRYNKPVLTNSRRSRNPQHHKLIFAIARCIKNNLPEGHFLEHSTPYEIIKAIMLQNKIVDFYMGVDGQVVFEAKSISYESMDEDEFSDISDVIFKTGAEILGIEEAELRLNYMDFL